eukprot:2630660-Prymnesium_polylepis.1
MQAEASASMNLRAPLRLRDGTPRSQHRWARRIARAARRTRSLRAASSSRPACARSIVAGPRSRSSFGAPRALPALRSTH